MPLHSFGDTMQKVKMIKTLLGVIEGEVYPRTFVMGNEYELNDSLVLGFMEQGGCELLGETIETKVIAPEETKPAKPFAKKRK